MSADFGFDSDPFKAVKSSAVKSAVDASRSSRSGSQRGNFQRAKSADVSFEDFGKTAAFEQPSFPDTSFGGGGGLPAAAERAAASRSRRRASIATPSAQTEGFGNFDAPNFDKPSFDQPSFDEPSFEQPSFEAAPQQPARRPARSRRASVVGGSSRSIDAGMEHIARSNPPSRPSGASRSNASVGSTGSGGKSGKSKSSSSASQSPVAPDAAPAPRRRTNRRASLAAMASPEMSQPAPAREPVREPVQESNEYGYGDDEEVVDEDQYGYGDDEPSGFGNFSNDFSGGGAARQQESAAPPAERQRSTRRMSVANTPTCGGVGNDPFADLKSGGGFSGGSGLGGSSGFSGSGASTKAGLGSGSQRQLNIMVPMTSAGPEKPKAEAAPGGKNRRRASMLGMVGTLTGGGGAADKMQSLDDGDDKKGKKGFFKDRNGERAPVGRNGSGDSGPTSGRDRRREGGLLARVDATAPSSRGGQRGTGVSYSDRIMMGN